jgi:UPF0755 protein
LIIGLLCVLLVVAGSATFYFLNLPTDAVDAGSSIFEVHKGESVNRISHRLQENNLIHSSLLFRLISKVRQTEKDIKAGKYRIEESSSTVRIHDLLVSGRQILKKVTIPEGWTFDEIAVRLEEENIVDGEQFRKVCTSEDFLASMNIPAPSVEGYLFPDTYYFSQNVGAKSVATHLIETMMDTIETIEPEYKQMTSRELHQKVIVASIVEREYRLEEEAPIIASVFYNRLHADMGLDSCATIEYIITEIQDKPHPSYLTYEDLKIESPYNTYLYAGLPPGAICNPGKTALEAAFHPADTDYWYFVLKNPQSGRHHFSEDISEHNRARRLYLKSVTN